MTELPGRWASALGTELLEFAERHRLRERSAELDTTPEFPRAEFRLMGRSGWLGLSVPPSAGGRGLNPSGAAKGLYALAYAGGTAFAKLALQPEFSSVLLGGSPELIEQWFRPLIQGERLIGNHVTEPGAGSDVGALAGEARRDGDVYVLTAEKSGAAFAADAEAALVYARTAPGVGTRGISAFLVDQESPGVTRGRVGDLGERWMRRGWVRYERVRVPASRRVGPEGTAFDHLREELNRERLFLAAIYLAVGRRAWESTVRYAGERRTFGRRLADHQRIGLTLVEHGVRLDAAELYVLDRLAEADRSGPTAEGAAQAKWLAVETSLAALDAAIQVHGSRGYSKELTFEQDWRDVRSGALAHGSSEIMLQTGARALWGRER